VVDWRNAVPGNNSGVNANETQLTPGTVNPNNFGLQFAYPVDGTIYGEPLVKTGLCLRPVSCSPAPMARGWTGTPAFGFRRLVSVLPVTAEEHLSGMTFDR
jgi:hypothetical protein